MGGAFCIAFVVISIKNQDALLIRDLLDRNMCDGPGDYLNLIYQREKLGIQSQIPWYKEFKFQPIKKPTSADVPSMAELEIAQAKHKAAEAVENINREKTAEELFEAQSKERIAQGRDTVLA